MKKIAYTTILIFFCCVLQAQHEGIRRYFNSYTLDYDTTANFHFYNDSTIDYFYKFMPQQNIADHTLGNYAPGSPFVAAIFSKQPEKHNFCHLNNYSAFVKSHNDVVYFDTKKPFTRFDFTGGAKGLEILKFVHSQNFGQHFNFTVNYDFANSEGFYLNSASKTNALYVAGAFTKKKYQSHINFIFNRINCNENAGIADVEMFESGSIRAVDNSVRLNNAANTISQLGFQYNHEYRFGKFSNDTIFREQQNDTIINKKLHYKFSIVHDITFDRYVRKYTDQPSEFYTNYYNNPNATNDSTNQKQLINKLLLSLNFQNDSTQNRLKIYAGLKHDLNLYNIDTLYNKNYNTTFLTGYIYFKHNSTSIAAEADYALFGTNIFDLKAKAQLQQLLSENIGLNAKISYTLTEPTPLETACYSNNFQWNKEFTKSGSARASANIFVKNIYLNAGLNASFLHNYVIFDQNALPRQVQTPNFIFDVFANKTFNFWKLHWFYEVSYQLITDKRFVRLPEFVAYSSLFFKTTMFKNALVLQIGIDAKFNTKTYGYAYMPATSVFYLQDEQKIGSYPNLGAFLGAKIKRFRIFGRLTNWNAGFMPQTYFSLYRIPENPLAFNFGISWEFYD